MINSKQKGNRIEREIVSTINKYLEGAGLQTMRRSGAGLPGDVCWTTKSPQWARDWLKEHQAEIKGEKTLRVPAYVRQCKREFNSVQGWVIYLRVPAEWNIPDNLLIVQPGSQYLLEQKELIDNRKKE